MNIPAEVCVRDSFTLASSEAAILTLPEGAASFDLHNLTKFCCYALVNITLWYEFVNGTVVRPPMVFSTWSLAVIN
jgi:hypothetical protein